MDIRHEQRGAVDRREFALYYRDGVERRVNTEPRRCALPGDEMSADETLMPDGYWGSAEDDAYRE